MDDKGYPPFSQGISTPIAPHEDPRVVRNRLMHRTSLTPLSVEATQYKDAVIAPFMKRRILEMIEAGYPIPHERVDDILHIIDDTPIHVGTPQRGSAEYDEATTDITVSQYSPHIETAKTSDAATVMLHEIGHKISGHTLSEEFASPRHEGSPIPDTAVAARVGAGVYKKYQHKDRARTRTMQDLTEAVNQSFIRWMVSDERPDFSTMTCATFFRGPKDISLHAYEDQCDAFATVLDDLPIENIVGFTYEDFLSVNAPGLRAPLRNKAYTDLENRFLGGATGLTAMYNSCIRLLQAPRPTLGGFDRRIELRERFELIRRVCVDDWKENQQEAKEEHGDFHIVQGHTRRAEIAPGPAPTNKNIQRDASIADARKVFPPRSIGD